VISLVLCSCSLPSALLVLRHVKALSRAVSSRAHPVAGFVQVWTAPAPVRRSPSHYEWTAESDSGRESVGTSGQPVAIRTAQCDAGTEWNCSYTIRQSEC
jgi:hypothetical protein